MNKSKLKNQIKIVGIVVIAVVIVYFFIKYIRPFGFNEDSLLFVAQIWFYWPVRTLLITTVTKPIILVALLLTLFLERLIPANAKQKIFSISFFQDMVWFVYETCLQAIIISTYVYALSQFYNAYLSAMTIDVIGQWPFWVRFAIGVLVTDFLYWLQHYINHKVPWFWEMHTVHHSQKEVNFFTDFRYHIVEYVIRHTVLIIPFFILRMDIPTIVWFSIFRNQYTHFYHGNIKTNLGFLKYILVTPQSHRVHHSVLSEHQDKNFGAVFSIWDFLFGTQVMDFNVYPKSGIKDERFPHEKTKNPIILAVMPVIQMLYAFRAIGRGILQRFQNKNR